MFPNLPESLSALDLAGLRALRSEIVAWHGGLDPATKNDPEVAANVTAAAAVIREIDAEMQARRDRALEARVFEAPEPEVPEAAETLEDEGPAADDDEDETDDAEDGDDDEEDEVDEVEASGNRRVPAVRGGLGARPAKDETTDRPAPNRPLITSLVAADRQGGMSAGEQFESWQQFAGVLAEVGSQISPATSQRFGVGVVRAQYPAERVLHADPRFNLQLFEPEVMAEMCAPCDPYVRLVGMNDTDRPVFNSLPQFEAPRGCVTVYPSPSLNDITGGYGIWTNEDDSDPEAVKNACQTIECATPEEYRIYGVYRCLTVKNMLAITFPELVEAYLNRLQAATSRLAEKQLLNAMGSEAIALDVDPYVYGSTVSLTSALLTYLALYAELERWDAPGFEVWLPRWVQIALKLDIIRRRRTDGGVTSIPSDATINALFTNAGFTPHWFKDTPTWATPIPSLSASGILNQLPNTVDMLVAPRGKFALMDKGELRIGVTGNNIYRDNASNARNEFTYFFERFEGIVNTNNLPAHLLTLPVCTNGIQIADIASVACNGLLEDAS